MKHLLVAFLLFGSSFLQECATTDVSLTVNVSPGGRECFSQDVAYNSQYEIEYQVIAGGELDVLFSFESPSGIAVVDNTKKSRSFHRDRAVEAGIYEFCFDNAFSHLSSKTVFFRIVVEEDRSEIGDVDAVAGAQELLPFEITVENFKTSTYQVSGNLRKSVEMQRAFAQIELRDRSIQEYNFERVNFWSGLQLFVMLSVALVNVLMIRGLFDDKRSIASSSSSKLRT